MAASYKLIGADLVEYGPASVEQIRQWITEGRVNAETKLQAEGGGEWKRLAQVAEFAAAPPGTAPSACPKCGEPFEAGFDSCWKCGTGKDGTPAKEWSVEDDAKKAAEQRAEPCPKCGYPILLEKTSKKGTRFRYCPNEACKFKKDAPS